VGLVKPKPGVFHAFIKHLLVLTTAIDVIVLGVTFTANQNGPLGEIQLIPDPVFTIPTDGSTFSAIACTFEGRLFLGSKEGCLFEIVYQVSMCFTNFTAKHLNILAFLRLKVVGLEKDVKRSIIQPARFHFLFHHF
jgi:nuclear pore complex protein Nup155